MESNFNTHARDITFTQILYAKLFEAILVEISKIINIKLRFGKSSQIIY